MKIKISLPVQILIALVVGVLFGVFAHDYVQYVSWAGEMFLRFLKMIVVPIVFCSMVTGVASLGNQGGLGRIAGKTFAFYVSTTAVATNIGLVLVNVSQPGAGSSLVSDSAAADEYTADGVSDHEDGMNDAAENDTDEAWMLSEQTIPVTFPVARSVTVSAR